MKNPFEKTAVEVRHEMEELNAGMTETIAEKEGRPVFAVIYVLGTPECEKVLAAVNKVRDEAENNVPDYYSLPHEEKLKRLHAACGSMAHLPGSVDEFLKEKHEETAREERKLEERQQAREQTKFDLWWAEVDERAKNLWGKTLEELPNGDKAAWKETYYNNGLTPAEAIAEEVSAAN